MTDFWTAFDNHAKAALATDEGKAFADSNFSFSHTGGGCTAWERDIDDTGCFIWITDCSGTSTALSTTEPDCWIIGAHGGDGGWSACREAKTVEEALAIADEVHRLVVAQDWKALDGENADLPLASRTR